MYMYTTGYITYMYITSTYKQVSKIYILFWTMPLYPYFFYRIWKLFQLNQWWIKVILKLQFNVHRSNIYVIVDWSLLLQSASLQYLQLRVPVNRMELYGQNNVFLWIINKSGLEEIYLGGYSFCLFVFGFFSNYLPIFSIFINKSEKRGRVIRRILF